MVSVYFLGSLILHFLTDVYFKVAVTVGQTFPPDSIITFRGVSEIIGDGYDVDSAKFMAPHGGTYRFTVTVMNEDGEENVYAQLMVNGSESCQALAAGEGNKFQTGVCSQVVRLAAGDEVWVVNPHWSTNNHYHKDFTTFEGFMIHGSA